MARFELSKTHWIDFRLGVNLFFVCCDEEFEQRSTYSRTICLVHVGSEIKEVLFATGREVASSDMRCFDS